MTLPSGGHARIDNDWLSALLPNLPIAEGIQLYLRAKGNLRQKGAGLGELMTATGNRDPRHTERAAQRLAASGLIVMVDRLFYDPAFAPAQITADSPASPPAQSPALTPANTSFSHAKNSVPEGENQDENPPERREEEKEEKTDGLLGITGIDWAADRTPPTDPENQTAEGTNQETQQAASFSLEKPENAPPEGGNTNQSARVSGCSAPPAPRAEHHGDDHDALMWFNKLAGYNFVTRYRADLARWFERYSPEFLRLAFDLAPTLDGAKGIFVFVDLLNQDSRRPWPVALQRQYAADFKARNAVQDGETPVVGEIRVMTDGTGRSGRVLEVYPDRHQLRLQTGQDETEAIDTPWSVTAPSVRRVS